MEDQAVTWASESHRRADMRRQKIADFKWSVYMFLHKYWWRTLYLFGVAGIYSVSMCRLNLYRKFPDDRCQWCGKVH